VNDIFRLDLEGYDKEYVRETLDGFLEGAPRRQRMMVEIRVSQVMFDRMAFEEDALGASYKGVPVLVADTGFDGTIEVVLGPLN